MRISAVVIGAVLAAASVPPASAAMRIVGDGGGQIGPYLERLAALRSSGEQVVIDGPCLSACTLVLGVIPRERICVTRRARLGFHAAWHPGENGQPTPSQGGTKLLMEIYPARELPIPGVDAKMILDLVTISDKKICSKTEVLSELSQRRPEILLTMGAGDIDQLVEPISLILK